MGGAKQTGALPEVQHAEPSQEPVKLPLVHRSPILHVGGGGGGEQVMGGARQTGALPDVQHADPSQDPVKLPLVHRSPTLHEEGLDVDDPPVPVPLPPGRTQAVLDPFKTYPVAQEQSFIPEFITRFGPHGLDI